MTFEEQIAADMREMVNGHRADPWINTLYAGGPDAGTRNKLRRGYDQGHRDALKELEPWLPSDSPHKHFVGLYGNELFVHARIGEVVVPKNAFAENHQHMRYATHGEIMEFERVRVHGHVGWLRRA